MALVVVVAVALLLLNVIATARVLRCESEVPKRRAQLAFTWLVPIVGATACLAVHRAGPTGRDPSLDYDTPAKAAIENLTGPHVD